VTYISGNPLRNDKIEKQQELVGKIVDLIKREQIRMNLIEEDKEILNETSVRKEIEELIEQNSMEDVSEAVELVDDSLKHEPIFSKSPFDLSKHELSDVNLIREDVEALEEEEDQTLEDIAIGIYQALPEDVQKGVRETYEWGNEYYNNVTKDLKLNWYQFQLDANEVVDTYLGPILDPILEGEDQAEAPSNTLYSGSSRPGYSTIEKNDVAQDDGLLKPGTSTVTFFDVVTDFFTDLWDNFFGEASSSRWNHVRIFKKKRSLQKKK